MDRNQPATCRLSGWLVFALLFALLSLCYISVLVTPYALSDEYVLLWARLVGAKWPQLVEIAYGRPTAGILHHLIFSLMNSIGDLRYIRLLNVIIITTLAWAVYRTLLYAGWNSHYAFFISLITATLPPFQAYASAAEDTHFPLAALATAGAFYAAEWGLKVQRPVHRWCLGAGSTLFVLLGITMVQPGAMFFWVFAVIVMFNPETNIPYLLRRLRWYGAMFSTGMILGFGIYEMGVAMYGSMLSPERSHLTKDLFAKALWFLQWPVVDALNLVKLQSNPWLACSVAVVGSGGMILYFRGGIKERFLNYIIALSVIPITYLPNLMTAENWSSYRTQIALASLILVYTFFALSGYVRLLHERIADQVLTGVLGVSALAALLLASYNVETYYALPQFLELGLMRSQLTSGNLAEARSIYVIGSTLQDSVAPMVRYDEFGVPFSAQPWAPEPAVELLLRELGYPRGRMPVKGAPVGGPIKPPDGALVVDMRKLANFRDDVR